MTDFASTFLLGILSGFIGSMLIAGPISVLVLSRVAQGRDSESYTLAAGAAVAEGIYASLAGVGAKLLVTIHGSVVVIARTLGALLLLLAGLALIRPAHPPKEAGLPKASRAFHGFWLGFAVAALNPALIAGWTAAVAALVSWELMPGSHIAAVFFGAGVSVGVALWFTFAIRMMRVLREKVRPATLLKIRHGTGAVLLVLAAGVAVKIVITHWPR